MKDALPGVLLVDIEMPRMDGFDLTAQRARRPAHCRASRSSSSRRAPPRSTAASAAELGVNAFLGKPLPGSQSCCSTSRNICAREIRAAGDDREVPGHPRDRQRRDQPRLPRARPVRRPRRGDQGARSTGKAPIPQTERMMHKAFIDRGLARRQAQPPAHRRHLRRGGRGRPQLPGDGVRARRDRSRRTPSVDQPAAGAARWWRSSSSASARSSTRFQHGVIHRDIKPGEHPAVDGRRDQGRATSAPPFQQRHGHETTQIDRRRLAGLHVARADPHGEAQPADRHLLARRHHVPPAHRPAAVRGVVVRRPDARGAEHAAAGAVDHAARRCRRSSTRSCSRRSAKDPAERYKTLARLRQGPERRPSPTLRLRRRRRCPSRRSSTELRGMPFFMDFGDVALWEVGAHRRLEHASPPSTVIIREGEQGDSFYLLIDGRGRR